jgi:hypothetical protein
MNTSASYTIIDSSIDRAANASDRHCICDDSCIVADTTHNGIRHEHCNSK